MNPALSVSLGRFFRRERVPLDNRKRYLQIAFNGSSREIEDILPNIPNSERILIEAGTPLIKREGVGAISTISYAWGGHVIADLKTADGAWREVEMAKSAGASGATVLGSAPVETIELFMQACRQYAIMPMIDMINVDDPLGVMRKLKHLPEVVIIHKGRDEESTKGKLINYRQINKIRSKFNVFIAVAGGIDLKEASSAVFNGADIVIVNVVSEGDPWKGISQSDDVSELAKKFLKVIE